jgi:hypothetical protein
MVLLHARVPVRCAKAPGSSSTLSELDDPSDHEPLISMGVLGGVGLLLLIVPGLEMAAQLLVSAPH